MNVLISNDDGYDAEGIKIIAEKLGTKHKVFVVAPDGNRSAVSSHISMFSPLSLKKISDNVYACSGFPADCVFVGLTSDISDFKFDCVVSGINLGGNLGTDIIYSGTCAAARQASLLGIPGIAVSVEPHNYIRISREDYKMDAMADFVLKNLEKFVSICNENQNKYFLNINGLSEDSYKGVRFTNQLCVRKYDDSTKIVEEEGKLHSVFVPGHGTADPVKESDYNLVHEGYVVLSLVDNQPESSLLVEGKGISL